MRAQKYVLLPQRGCRRVRGARGGDAGRSWRRKASCRPCSRAGSRSPPGVWSAPIAWRPRCSRSRSWEDAGVGMALIRDGNGTRSFETLMRYRSAAMAEFWRALKTLKALQAEQADRAEQAAGADLGLEMPVGQSPRRRPCARSRPDPQRAARTPIGPDRTNPSPSWPTALPEYVLPDPPGPAARCTSPRRPGFRTNPSQRSRSRRRRRCRSRTGSSGRSCDRRRTHTIGSGRRRRGDRAPGHRRPARRAARPRRPGELLSARRGPGLAGPRD